MAQESTASPACLDPRSPEFGFRDEAGHWRPPYAATYAPVFVWPARIRALLKWTFGYPGFLWPINTVFLGLACVTWFLLQPSLARTAVLRPGWILLMLGRNLALLWLVAGSLHLVLYTLKLHGTRRKYDPHWQASNNPRFLFRDQIYDNVFRSVLAVPIWTAYEVLYVWGAANHWWPSLNPQRHPVAFVAMFVFVPFWREAYFYFIHRLTHWRPLMTTVHSVHHLNVNPGPWSGLAMHPVEHVLYFSMIAIHLVIPSHPLHMFFNSQLTALAPALGHQGFEGPLFDGKLETGNYFHYLHHRFVNCNFGTDLVPLDRWFGSYYDGQGKLQSRVGASD
jgi:sterol desaturase/sphingolipid hydroxylase (fatty acid hydroxylase superfamily)